MARLARRTPGWVPALYENVRVYVGGAWLRGRVVGVRLAVGGTRVRVLLFEGAQRLQEVERPLTLVRPLEAL